MTNLLIAFLAYLIDSKFGEFSFIKHPVIYIGELITFFENRFYKNSVWSGLFLVLFVLFTVGFITVTLSYLLSFVPPFVSIIFLSFIASMFIAHNMLRSSVLGVIQAEDKKEAISMLVSRDTKDMNESDINKAAIETYAENLSDGVLAPLFYLVLFGLVGIVLHKAVNTMDSMVGYRNKKYEKYGKVAAILDDVLNYIPSRLTALLIMLLGKKKKLFAFYEDGQKHDSPNAGHPITAMALCLGVKLGGDTSYFGTIKHKAFFGEGREEITQDDVKNSINLVKIL